MRTLMTLALFSQSFLTPFNFAETSHTFPTYQCLQKGMRDFFLFCLDLGLFAKIKRTLFLHTRFFSIFINNSRSKQNKKIPNTLL